MLSLYLNYRAGGLSTTGYHAFNLAVHLASALMLYTLVVLTFGTPALRQGTREAGPYAALISALLFVAHPVQTEAVTYISQRFTSMAALFCICSIASYSGMRLSSNQRARAWLYAASLSSAVLGMKTKEICMTLPVALLAYEWMFFEDTAVRRIKRLLPHLMTMLIVPVTVLYVNRQAGEMFGELASSSRADTDVARADYLMTQLTVIVKYLGMVLLPVGQNLDYDQQLYKSVWDSGVIGSAALLAAFAGFGVYVLRKRPEHRMAAFGLAWFFVALWVESSVIPIRDLMFEHRMYLPMAGLASAAGGAVAVWAGDSRSRNRAMFAVVASAVVALSFCTVARNNVWRSEIALWEDSANKSPHKARTRNNVGTAYYQEERYTEAVAEYEYALRLAPGYADAMDNMGLAYAAMGRHEDALFSFKRALLMNPSSVKTHYQCGLTHARMGQYALAESSYRKALALDRNYALAHMGIGSIRYAMRSYPEALTEYQTAIRCDPSNADAHYNCGLALVSLGREAEALSEMGTTLMISPAHALALAEAARLQVILQ